jgi:hypothetical protein
MEEQQEKEIYEKFKINEEFKSCPYAINLEVSQYGRVRRKKGNKILKQYISNKQLVVKNLESKNPFERVHRLVALTWLNESYKKGMLVHHKDFNSYNNRVDNLEWLTKEDHDKKHGRKESDENDDENKDS